jgi:hypothetical protein
MGKDLWQDNGLDLGGRWGNFGPLKKDHPAMTIAITMPANTAANPITPAISIHGAICEGRFAFERPLVATVGVFERATVGVDVTTG